MNGTPRINTLQLVGHETSVKY